MPLKKSPGGSLFLYPCKGGELFGRHLGGFGADEDALISRMKAVETPEIGQFFVGRYSTCCRTSDRPSTQLPTATHF
jgi:hypothetical protein